MTIQELINQLAAVDIRLILGIFTAPPVLTWLTGRIHQEGDGGYPPWNFVYSFYVYLVCVPGMPACMLTAYSLFFIRQNLLNVNFAVYFLPIICMIVTLVLIRKNTDGSQLPGVDRLYALMIIIVVSFAIALFILKTRVLIFFGGTVKTLIWIAVFCFVLLKWGSYMLFRSKNEQTARRPSYDVVKPGSRKSRTGKKKAEKELEAMKRKMGLE